MLNDLLKQVHFIRTVTGNHWDFKGSNRATETRKNGVRSKPQQVPFPEFCIYWIQDYLFSALFTSSLAPAKPLRIRSRYNPWSGNGVPGSCWTFSETRPSCSWICLSPNITFGCPSHMVGQAIIYIHAKSAVWQSFNVPLLRIIFLIKEVLTKACRNLLLEYALLCPALDYLPFNQNFPLSQSSTAPSQSSSHTIPRREVKYT